VVSGHFPDLFGLDDGIQGNTSCTCDHFQKI